MLGGDGVESVAHGVEVAEECVGHELDARGPGGSRAQEPGALDLRQVGEGGEQLAAEGLGDLVRDLERGEVAQRSTRTQGVRSVGVDAGSEERQHARGNLDLRRRARVHHDALLGRIGALEQLACLHPDAVAAGRAVLGQDGG